MKLIVPCLISFLSIQEVVFSQYEANVPRSQHLANSGDFFSQALSQSDLNTPPHGPRSGSGVAPTSGTYQFQVSSGTFWS